MPKVASLSDSCTSDRCRPFSLVISHLYEYQMSPHNINYMNNQTHNMNNNNNKIHNTNEAKKTTAYKPRLIKPLFFILPTTHISH